MKSHTAFLVGASVVLSGCGSGSAPAEEPTDTVEPVSAGAEQTAAPESSVVYGADPRLNVYVQGPNPDPGEPIESDDPDGYHASIVITNTGDAPADVHLAHIRFDVVRGEEPVDCGPGARMEPIEGPMSLGPGEAHTYVGRLRCELSAPGDYEVRAYMSFIGGIPERDLERYYAGSYTVHVP